MKVCSNCKEEKDLDEFNWKSKAKGIKQSRCKTCYREYNRDYYHAGEKSKQIKRVQDNNRKVYNRYTEWKKKQKCTVCNEDARECLELHHRDPSGKEFNPSQAIMYGWKKFLIEASKCIVVCSNCHKKIHSGRITVP